MTTRATSSIFRRANQSARCWLKAKEPPVAILGRLAAIWSLAANARRKPSFVRNGPTSRCIMACKSAIASVGLAPTSGRRAVSSSTARNGVAASLTPLTSSEADAANRPASSPNTNASVMAFPDSRLAPFAPPTASPAAKRFFTLVSRASFTLSPPM